MEPNDDQKAFISGVLGDLPADVRGVGLILHLISHGISALSTGDQKKDEDVLAHAVGFLLDTSRVPYPVWLRASALLQRARVGARMLADDDEPGVPK